jgi:sec-independent protein translocase protein TatC
MSKEKMSLIDHLTELRNRLLYSVAALLIAFGICYAFSEEIYRFLLAPLEKVLVEKGAHQMIYTGLAEAFFTYIKLSFWAAFCITFPIFAYHIWRFIAPGLYKNEKKVFMPVLFATPILFIMGASLAYYFIFPLAWKFFASFEIAQNSDGLPLLLEAKISEYLSITMQLIFAFGLSFQLPILLILLNRVGFVTIRAMKKNRKYVFVGAFIFGAILTPPDIISQIGLAIPLYTLYEFSIIFAQILDRKRRKNTQEPSYCEE